MKAKPVTALPVLDQSQFPQLPLMPDDAAMLLVFGSKLGRYEPEAVLGVLTTAAVRGKGWKPVSVHDFFDIAEMGGVPHAMLQGVVNAIWELAKDGAIEIVRFDETDYVVPSATFAANLGSGQLQYCSSPRAPS